MGELKSVCIFLIFIGIFNFIEPSQANYEIKCQFGKYYNDGCTACICDFSTGETICDKSRCPEHPRTCPNGKLFKDRNGNHCKCYEDTGAVFCSIMSFRKKMQMIPDTISHRSNQYQEDISLEEEVADQIATDTITPIVIYKSESSNLRKEKLRPVTLSSKQIDYVNLMNSEEVVSDMNSIQPLTIMENSQSSWDVRSGQIAFTPYRAEINQLLAAYRQRRKATQ